MAATPKSKTAKSKRPETKRKGLMGKIAGSFRSKKTKAPAKTAPQPSPFAREQEEEAPVFWSSNRLNVVEKLLGLGYTTAGGARRIRDLAHLMELDASKSLLLLGPGLGGMCETLVEKTDVWITGVEPDPELAKIGAETMMRQGFKRKAPIRYNALEEVQFKPKSFDAMLSIDMLHFIENKKALFEAVIEALRIPGEIMFTTFVLPDTNPPDKLVQTWSRLQPMTPHLWPGEAMLGMLNNLGLQVEPPVDLTDDYRKCVLRAWAEFMATMKKEELLEKSKDVIEECARWTALITALEKGALKVWRFKAVRLQEKRKSVEELMKEAQAAAAKE